MDEEVLKKAGIEEADAFVAVTEVDNHNIMAAQIARYIFNVPKVVCRIYDPLRRELFSSLGIDALSPTTTFAQMLKDRIEG
jgi:trk system potassium uptake protein TrkA